MNFCSDLELDPFKSMGLDQVLRVQNRVGVFLALWASLYVQDPVMWNGENWLYLSSCSLIVFGWPVNLGKSWYSMTLCNWNTTEQYSVSINKPFLPRDLRSNPAICMQAKHPLISPGVLLMKDHKLCCLLLLSYRFRRWAQKKEKVPKVDPEEKELSACQKFQQPVTQQVWDIVSAAIFVPWITRDICI